jgi:hypothetical protein
MPLAMDEFHKSAHLFRSRLLDRFSIIETELLAHLAATDLKVAAKAPLGQKMDALRALIEIRAERPKVTKKLSVLLDRLQPLARLRSDIVHSGIEVVTRAGGAKAAIFQNVGHRDIPDRYRPVMLDEKAMEAVIKLASELANQVKQLNQVPSVKPPSPPPPSPGATDGL